MPDETHNPTRRDFLRATVRSGALLTIGGMSVAMFERARGRDWVWQIDPYKCTMCGQCATECVLDPSAVKCVHTFPMCGYCDLCTGYFEPQPNSLNTGAENQLCPVGAIKRKFIEEPYFEYTIDESLCIGCAKCVAGCTAFGNGSLHLQIRRDKCVDCNDCSIARKCPARAISRVPADTPYLIKDGHPH